MSRPGQGQDPSRPSEDRRPIRAGVEGVEWVCPRCQSANPIAADACRTCGAPFARLFEDQTERPAVDPERAVARSLLFPGLGHFALGRGADGLARAVIFGYTVAAVVSILAARLGRGIGPFLPLLLVSALAGVAVYVLTAVDAGRLARRESPVLSTRALLFGAVGLMLLSVVMLILLGARAGSPG
jgi:hypothetical protein